MILGDIMFPAFCPKLNGMLLSGSGLDAAIWQWCRGGDQGLHGMLVSALQTLQNLADIYRSEPSVYT
jgi:hypothetical protein